MSGLVWDSDKLESSLDEFANAIYNFREKKDDLVTVERRIETQLIKLETCEYIQTIFADILYEIQESIYHLSPSRFYNLPQWVAKLNEDVGKKFAQRLSVAILAWVVILLGKEEAKVSALRSGV